MVRCTDRDVERLGRVDRGGRSGDGRLQPVAVAGEVNVAACEGGHAADDGGGRARAREDRALGSQLGHQGEGNGAAGRVATCV